MNINSTELMNAVIHEASTEKDRMSLCYHLDTATHKNNDQMYLHRHFQTLTDL